MGLNIKNTEVERLAAEVARMASESKTEAIRRALLERRERLQAQAGYRRGRRSLSEYLGRQVWPLVPQAELGRTLTTAEEDDILGYGGQGW
ncbi:MAG TPA: type II toxin-antitoxin system VapB family antitoxin [Bryobacteraceae bacterium]|nr:type II toxin-antitoxin system VapB family antitoxin [Bryobacteraceae bacterium]